MKLTVGVLMALLALLLVLSASFGKPIFDSMLRY